jgi:hypothetical protein
VSVCVHMGGADPGARRGTSGYGRRLSAILGLSVPLGLGSVNSVLFARRGGTGIDSSRHDTIRRKTRTPTTRPKAIEKRSARYGRRRLKGPPLIVNRRDGLLG